MSSTNSQRNQKNSLRLQILIPCILVLVISVTLVTIYLFPKQTDKTVLAAENEISFVAPQDSTIRLVSDKIVSVSSAGYTVYSLSGGTSGFVSCPLTAPTVCVAESGCLVYGAGTDKAYYLQPGENAIVITAPGNIIHGCVCNKKGFALVTDSQYYKGELTLYDLKGNVLFSYKCSEGFPYLCSLSPGFDLIACAVLCETDSDIPTASLYTFSPDRETVLGKLVLDASVINGVYCNSYGCVTVIDETGIIIANESATLQSQYKLENESLLYYSVTSDYTFLLTKRQDAGARYGLVTVGTDGTELARSTSSVSYNAISASGDYVALLSDRSVQVFDQSLSAVYTVAHKYSISDISLSDNNKLVCRTDSGVSVYKY